MLSKDVLKYIAYIEIQTRRLLSSSMAGDSRSALRGVGFEFDQIRDYQLGDDIRFVDWRGSARAQKLLTKEYIEERNRTILLAVDVSASSFFGSVTQPKYSYVSQIAAVLALVAQYGKDKVGLILFSDTIELYIPPAASRTHTYLLLMRLFSHRPVSTRTDFTCISNHLLRIAKRDALVFLISDFIGVFDQRKWCALKRLYDVVAIRGIDPIERALLPLGFISAVDVETGESGTIDARSRCVRVLNAHLETRFLGQATNLRRSGIDVLDVQNNDTCMGELVRFFRRRMTY